MPLIPVELISHKIITFQEITYFWAFFLASSSEDSCTIIIYYICRCNRSYSCQFSTLKSLFTSRTQFWQDDLAQKKVDYIWEKKSLPQLLYQLIIIIFIVNFIDFLRFFYSSVLVCGSHTWKLIKTMSSCLMCVCQPKFSQSLKGEKKKKPKFGRWLMSWTLHDLNNNHEDSLKWYAGSEIVSAIKFGQLFFLAFFLQE